MAGPPPRARSFEKTRAPKHRFLTRRDTMFWTNTRSSITLDVEWDITFFREEQGPDAHSSRATTAGKSSNPLFGLTALTIRRCTASDPG
jgi:hypothetical protein